VQVARLQDGSRKVRNISEVAGVVDDRVETEDIFVFERVGVAEDGKVQGRFRATGYKPKVLERIRVSGLELPADIFDETLDVNL
jgi:pilus assembly protein CpaF